MKISKCTDQSECRSTLRKLNVEEVFKPLHPMPSCDGIMKLKDALWLVGSNVRGFITLFLIEECTDAEAFAFFDSIHPGRAHAPRVHLVIIGETSDNQDLSNN